MKIAAVQLCAELADVKTNLIKSEKLIIEAAKSGAKIVLLPEFFTSGIGFCPEMLDVAEENRGVLSTVQRLLQKSVGDR